MSHALDILEGHPLRETSLPGFVNVELPSGIVIADVMALISERRRWASPPSKPMMDRDGAVMKDPNAKVRFTPIIEFSSKKIRNRFGGSAIAALRQSHPEALP